MDNTVRISGILSDFNGNPLPNGEVYIKDADLSAYAYAAKTDENGKFAIDAKKGSYMAITGVTDYAINFLEYWGWNIPAFEDMEINMRIDGIEVYGINAFLIQRSRPNITMMVYFRPMSLVKCKIVRNTINPNSESIVDIAPELEIGDIDITVDGQTPAIMGINRVTERAMENQIKLTGYLVQLTVPESVYHREYVKIHISLRDRATGERGEGCLFWKKPNAFNFFVNHDD